MADEVKNGQNLMLVDHAGNIVWKAVPPTQGKGMQDCFTYLQWDGQTLTANTWSCFRVMIDLQDGNVTILEFTK